MLAAALLLLPTLAEEFERPQGSPPTSSPRGFSGKNADTEKKWEQRYRSLPQASVIRESNRILSAEPHHVGSPYDEKNARWILSKFREFGLDASIETFYPLFSTPKERILEMIEPAFFRASLAETPVEGDPTSSQTAAQLPTYNVYSIDGDVTAPLVYVNYGVPADYERLARLGVNVRGKVVIARYGASWRGIKPKVAAEHGAVGCLIYSDPRDDGYFEGDVYPAGPYRPPQGVQRGSVSDGPLYAGDPLTPGVGATNPNARVDLKDAKTLTKIPVLPISYGDAKPLLAALAGPVSPREWRGALPITYHVGPGPAKVHLKVSFDWKITPVRDVIARIPGSQYPDEWVIRGNHHDAWVNGSSDPVSGLSALLEEASAFGTLVKEGWKPRRTILLCAWDGEEPGLLGSTEWAETHAGELRNKAVVYINSDSSGRGFFNASGSHSLETLVNEAASEVEDPEKKIPILRRLRLRRIEEASNAEDRRDARERANLRIGALGSGSDYTTFVDHLGIASLNLGFGGEGGGGVYHSIYDDFTWYTRFSDTDFSYGRALAQTAGTILIEAVLCAPREGAARSRLRPIAAREGVGITRGRREGIRVAVRFGSRIRRRADCPHQCAPALCRASAHAGGRTSAAALVQALRLCARLLHRLRRQDSPRRARGHRGKTVPRGPGKRPEDRRGNRELRRPRARGGQRPAGALIRIPDSRFQIPGNGARVPWNLEPETWNPRKRQRMRA